MLADITGDSTAGRLEREAQLPSTAKHAILDFIARQLPVWRDRPDRPAHHAEDRLTESLCDHLNSAAYRSTDMTNFRFGTETGDETNAGRTIDLAVKPLGTTLIIDTRRSTIFDTVLPIECKRLPTPPGTNRDHREYVFNQHKSTGGMQRFKRGHHAETHDLAAMVGYVQQDTCVDWHTRTTQWIDDLIAAKEQGWSKNDHLRVEHDDARRKVTVLSSKHTRESRPKIELRHLWIEMA